MEKDSKKKNIRNINEELMMNLMSEGVKKEGLQTQQETGKNIREQGNPHKAEPSGTSGNKTTRRKKNIDTDYESIFFKKSETHARDGKTVYIRSDFHEKISRIVHVIGRDKISIYGYLDNLLDYHFKEFGEDIIKSFNDKFKPIL